MKLLVYILSITFTCSLKAQTNDAYVLAKDTKVNWYMDLDAGTTSWGGFALSTDLHAVYKKNLFATYFMSSWVNNQVDVSIGLLGDPGLTTNSNDNSIHFGIGYGFAIEKERLQLTGHGGPAFILMEDRNIVTVFGSISPSLAIAPSLNIGLNLYGAATGYAPSIGILFRFRYLMNNRRTFIPKNQRKFLK